jgi:hypothetical protein
MGNLDRLVWLVPNVPTVHPLERVHGMIDTTIFIPTYRRVEAQATWAALATTRWASRTLLVVAEDEAEAHRAKGRPVIVCPVQGRVARVRQWLMDNCDTRYAIVMDDDLCFQKRRYDPGKFRSELLSDDEMAEMLDRIRVMMDQVPMVGIDARSGGNRSAVPAVLNSRMFGLVAHDVEVFRREYFDYDRVQVMEDFDVILQHLRRGFYTAKLTTHCKGDVGGSNSEGGCSVFRDAAMQTASANGLQVLHPEFVKVVEKETKSWGAGLTTRTDVRISWAKAFKAGQELRDLLGENQEPVPDWTGLAPDWEIF